MSEDGPEAAEALAALRGLPGFATVPAGVAVARLGGLTNRVFRVDLADGPVVLRLPGAGTEAYIDREVEAVNAVAAARAGVSPEVIAVDAARGVMLSRHVAGLTMTPERFAAGTGAPGRAAVAFRRLHRSGAGFDFRFELFAMIDEYLRVLAPMGVALPAGYHEVLARAEAVRAALAAAPAALAPCHCDPLCENFIDTGTRMWLVDWEYSGMNDPAWDLADLAVEAGMEAGAEAEMLAAYCDGTPPAGFAARVTVLRAMVDLLWTLWGLIQHGHGNPAEDFMAYAAGRFARCEALMAREDFAVQVALVGRG